METNSKSISNKIAQDECYNSLKDTSRIMSIYGCSHIEAAEAFSIKHAMIFKANYFVTMTDKFMSGWGMAKGKTNRLIIACDTYEQAKIVMKNAARRSEMKYINYHVKMPKLSKNHYPSYKHISELGDAWTKD